MDAAKIDRLIRQLGSKQFAEREAATKQLDALGELALPALRKFQDDSDLEVRRRVADLVKILTKRRARMRAEAWNILRRFGGRVDSDTGTPGGVIGRIDLTSATWVSDDDLVMLQWLDDAGNLVLSDTPITDTGLVHLKKLYKLKGLALTSTKVTNAGLEHLKHLDSLMVLVLCDTQVTDEGLKHLKSLPKLYLLDLSRTQITDTGLDHIKELKGLKGLHLSHTKVTDAGVAKLKSLPRLESLWLEKTGVTAKGVADLRKALPNLKYARTNPRQQSAFPVPARASPQQSDR